MAGSLSMQGLAHAPWNPSARPRLRHVTSKLHGFSYVFFFVCFFFAGSGVQRFRFESLQDMCMSKSKKHKTNIRKKKTYIYQTLKTYTHVFSYVLCCVFSFEKRGCIHHFFKPPFGTDPQGPQLSQGHSCAPKNVSSAPKCYFVWFDFLYFWIKFNITEMNGKHLMENVSGAACPLNKKQKNMCI